MLPAQRKTALLIIFLTVFIDLLGFGIVLPLLPIYGKQLAEIDGYSARQTGWIVGLLMSSFSAMQLVFLPIWGRLSDRIGRRPVIVIGLLGSTFFYAMFGLATLWRSLTGMFIARIGAGIAGATISTAQAFIADSTAKEHRARGMAMIGAAFALGFTLGPLLGAVALFAGGEVSMSPAPGFVAAALSGAALLLAIFRLPESLSQESESAARKVFDGAALRAAISVPSIGLLLVASFVAIFSFANFESTLALQIERMASQTGDAVVTSAPLRALLNWIAARGYTDPEDARLIVVFATFAYLGIILTLAQGFLVRRLSGRMSEGAMATMGGTTAILGFLLLAWAARREDYTLLLEAMSLEVVGFAFVNPSLQSLISRRSDPRLQGSILGLSQSMSSLARILGPLCGVILFTKSSEWPYWAAAICMVLGVAMIVPAVRSGTDYVERDPSR